MHVAHFIHRYPPALGGAEAYFARLGRWLTAQRYRITVWTTTAIDLTAFWSSLGTQLRPSVCTENGIIVKRYEPSHWFGQRPLLKLLSFIPIPAWQCLTQSCNPVSFRMLYDAAMGDAPCDVVHASALPYAWPLVCGLKLARRKKVPFLLTPFLHLGNPDDPSDRTRRVYTSKAMRYLLAAADAVFVQTELEGEALKQAGIPLDRIVLQGLGVDPAECTGGDRLRTRSAWGVETDECVVGHLANLSRAKGTIDLLRSARVAWERGARFGVVLAGPRMPDFNRFWQDFEPKDRVRILGRLSDDEKRDFFAGIDAFCLPSRSDSFGLVLLEAWANGKPNIAYRAGGVAELLRDGEDGRLIRCGDLTSLAEALTKVERDPSARESWGRAGHDRIRREFVWENKLQIVERVMTRPTVSRDAVALRRGAQNVSAPRSTGD